MPLWILWFQAVRSLRPACARFRTFAWMVLILAGFCIRQDHLGVTSFVRCFGLAPSAYPRFLHLFHSTGLNLEALTALWARLVLRLFQALEVNGALLVLADGIKAPREGRKMPAVKSLHQESTNNTKPPYIMGHSLQALSVLVRSPAGTVAAIPITARIHEGVVFSNRDRRTLLDKLVALLLTLDKVGQRPMILIADAYYASRKVIIPLLATGHHLVTRARINTVAYLPASSPTKAKRGRPRRYGAKIQLRKLAAVKKGWRNAPSPIPGEGNVTVAFRHADLLWRPTGRLVRFVIVHHPKRGTIFLMATDLTLAPMDILLLYSYRFRIEVGFRQAIQVLGAYAYHFWMRDMHPIRKGDGNQHPHHETPKYRDNIRRKISAYHRFVQLGCIAQGLLLHLAVNHGPSVWKHYKSWMRTMNLNAPPSERVVASALGETAGEFLATHAETQTLHKFLAPYQRHEDPHATEIPKLTRSA